MKAKTNKEIKNEYINSGELQSAYKNIQYLKVKSYFQFTTLITAATKLSWKQS